MIYFARTDPGEHPDVDYVKIGYTKGDDARKRIGQLQTSSPFKIDLVATIAGGDTNYESALHNLFADDRVTGEWFRVTDQILTYIHHFATTYGEIAPAKEVLSDLEELTIENRVKEVMESDTLIYRTLMNLCVQSSSRFSLMMDRKSVYKNSAKRVADAVLILRLAGVLNISSQSMEYHNSRTHTRAQFENLP